MNEENNHNMIVSDTYIEAQSIDEGSEVVRNILFVLFRNKKVIIVFFFAIIFMTALFSFLSPKIYQSDARLLIKVGRENVSMDPSVVGPTMSISQNREYEVNSELATITSQVIAERVVENVGLENFVRKGNLSAVFGASPEEDLKAKAVARIMENVNVEVEKKSSIINLSFQSDSADLAQKTLKNIVSSYLDRHIEVHKAQASPQFFQERLEELSTDLWAKEEKLKTFKAKNSISSMEDQKTRLLEQVTIFQREIDDLGSQISASQAQIVSLSASLNKRSPLTEVSRVTGRTNAVADSIKERLMGLRLKEADLASRYPDDDRALVDVRQQIRLAESALAQEVETHTEVTIGLDSNYQTMKLALDNERARNDALVARKATLNDKASNRQEDLEALMKHETELARLERDVDIANKEYRSYRDNHQRARMSAELDMDKVSNVSIVQPATLPLRPIKPKILLNLLLGVFLGIFGGIGLVMFLEYFDGSLKTPEDVNRRLGLPVLASVSLEEFESCT